MVHDAPSQRDVPSHGMLHLIIRIPELHHGAYREHNTRVPVVPQYSKNASGETSARRESEASTDLPSAVFELPQSEPVCLGTMITLRGCSSPEQFAGFTGVPHYHPYALDALVRSLNTDLAVLSRANPSGSHADPKVLGFTDGLDPIAP